MSGLIIGSTMGLDRSSSFLGTALNIDFDSQKFFFFRTSQHSAAFCCYQSTPHKGCDVGLCFTSGYRIGSTWHAATAIDES